MVGTSADRIQSSNNRIFSRKISLPWTQAVGSVWGTEQCQRATLTQTKSEPQTSGVCIYFWNHFLTSSFKKGYKFRRAYSLSLPWGIGLTPSLWSFSLLMNKCSCFITTFFYYTIQKTFLTYQHNIRPWKYEDEWDKPSNPHRGSLR